MSDIDFKKQMSRAHGAYMVNADSIDIPESWCCSECTKPMDDLVEYHNIGYLDTCNNARCSICLIHLNDEDVCPECGLEGGNI